MGNWKRLNTRGKPVSEGVIGVLGNRWRLPAWVPVAISTSIILSCKVLSINLEPLQRPMFWLMLRNRMTGWNSFNFRECGGIPDNVNELRNSGG